MGGVKNLQVTDPTTNSLRVRWEPAEGDVRQYHIIYVPAAGGAESMVSSPPQGVANTADTCTNKYVSTLDVDTAASPLLIFTCCLSFTDSGVWDVDKHGAERPAPRHRV